VTQGKASGQLRDLRGGRLVEKKRSHAKAAAPGMVRRWSLVVFSAMACLLKRKECNRTPAQVELGPVKPHGPS
jgi:hypothetical protein